MTRVEVSGAPTTNAPTTTDESSSPINFSSQVNWWTVHEFVSTVIEAFDSLPMVGSVEWCTLSDDDPRKVAALYDAAQHWALRVETCQQAECEASHAISAAEDWHRVARQIARRSCVYIPMVKAAS
jgi:hypothetical protein